VIGNKSHSGNISFNLKGNIIKCEDEVKTGPIYGMGTNIKSGNGWF
jgi:hypothetical protein